MEDYKLKYANPINPFTYENIIHNLNTWHSNTKEEIEIYIYLTKELKTDTLNRYPTRSKSKTLILIDKLKKVCQSHMKCIYEYLTELQHKSHLNIVEERIYIKLEAIRANYNNMLLNNQKFILSIKFLIELKNKYLQNKNELQLSKRTTINKTNSHSKYGLNSSKIHIDYDIINQHTRNLKQHLFINNNNNYTNYITKCKKNTDSYQQKSKFNSYLNINKSYANINQVKKVIKHSRSYINPNVRNGSGLNERLVSYCGGNKKSTVCNNNKKYLANSNICRNNNNNNLSLECCSIKDKMFKENIELPSEMKNIKSQLNIMNETIKLLSEKVEMVQKENVALKQHNRNLSTLLQKRNKITP
jgi:hypothetical protein